MYQVITVHIKNEWFFSLASNKCFLSLWINTYFWKDCIKTNVQQSKTCWLFQMLWLCAKYNDFNSILSTMCRRVKVHYPGSDWLALKWHNPKNQQTNWLQLKFFLQNYSFIKVVQRKVALFFLEVEREDKYKTKYLRQH